MNQFHFKLLLLFAGIFVFAACNNDDELPDEPVINSVEFLEAEKNLTINFTDGDGNFGLPPEDTLPPYQALIDTINEIPNEFHYNLWVDLFKLTDGEYQLIQTPTPFDFRIPSLTPAGQNKQLQVKVTYDLSFDLVNLGSIDPGDTLRFDVTIVDRDLNVSNTVNSEGHILRE